MRAGAGGGGGGSQSGQLHKINTFPRNCLQGLWPLYIDFAKREPCRVHNRHKCTDVNQRWNS